MSTEALVQMRLVLYQGWRKQVISRPLAKRAVKAKLLSKLGSVAGDLVPFVNPESHVGKHKHPTTGSLPQQPPLDNVHGKVCSLTRIPVFMTRMRK